MSKFETVLKNVDLSNSPYQYQNYTFHLFFEDDEILKIMHKTKYWREILKTSGAFFTGLEYLEKETDFNESYACFATNAKRTYADDVINIIYTFTSVTSALLNLPDQTLKLIPSHKYLYENTTMNIPKDINVQKVERIQVGHLHTHIILSVISAVVLCYEYDKNTINTDILKSNILLNDKHSYLKNLINDYSCYADINSNELKQILKEIFGVNYNQQLGLPLRYGEYDYYEIFNIKHYKNKN